MTNEEFEAYVDNLQAEVFSEAKTAYGEKGFQRWRTPRYHGRMLDANGYGRVTGGCGDTIEMFLRIENNSVRDASYTTTGCTSSGLCGSFAAELAIGREAEEIFDLTGEDVLEYIGTFPEKEQHCAHLAIATLHEAVHSFLVQKK
jgi:nitrogen fixation NifU-like protein